MNYFSYPTDWKDLQIKTAKLLNECGFQSEIEKTIKTVRGSIVVDVFVKNEIAVPNSVYLIECKYWNSKVSQTIIHSFRTVVSDYGANHGYIITKKGFQKGAFAASDHTNIELLNWNEFIGLFRENWSGRMFMRIWNRYQNISHYRGDNIPIYLKAKHFSIELKGDSKKEYEKLLEESNVFLNTDLFLNFINSVRKGEIAFPLDKKIINSFETYQNESQFFDSVIIEQDNLLQKFDIIFGKKIRELEERWP